MARFTITHDNCGRVMDIETRKKARRRDMLAYIDFLTEQLDTTTRRSEFLEKENHELRTLVQAPGYLRGD